MNAIAPGPPTFVGLPLWRSATGVCVMGGAHYSRKTVLGGRVISGVAFWDRLMGAAPRGLRDGWCPSRKTILGGRVISGVARCA